MSESFKPFGDVEKDAGRKVRKQALDLAGRLEHVLPQALMVTMPSYCEDHQPSEADAEAEVERMNLKARAVEDATVERIFRNAKVFAGYIAFGVTPADWAEVDFELGLAGQ